MLMKQNSIISFEIFVLHGRSRVFFINLKFLYCLLIRIYEFYDDLYVINIRFVLILYYYYYNKLTLKRKRCNAVNNDIKSIFITKTLVQKRKQQNTGLSRFNIEK